MGGFITNSKYNSPAEQIQENKDNIEKLDRQILKIGNTVVRVVGAIDNINQLPSDLTAEDVGEAYFVGTETTNPIYAWLYVNGVLAWSNQGTIKGEEGQGFNYMGAWVSGSEHYPYDIITFQGSALVCKLYIASSVITPNLDTQHFDIFASKGAQGIQGNPGAGLPTGGSVGDIIRKKTTTDYDTEWETPDMLPVENSAKLIESGAVFEALIGVERVETIYDKDSTDADINWGYTGGIANETTITGKDFSKYKKLIIKAQGWLSNAYRVDSTVYEIDLSQLVSGDYRGQGPAPTINHQGSIYGSRIITIINQAKTTLTHFGSNSNVSSGSIDYYYYITKIEGVY